MKASFFSILLLNLACLTGGEIVGQCQQVTAAGAVQLVADGKADLTQGRHQEALQAFTQAAKTGNVEGAFCAGDMLLTQLKHISGRERILESYECLSYLLLASTNHHPRACADLSLALENGIGIPTNRVAAYAWLKIASELDVAFLPDLDRLVVQLEPDEVRKAQDLAREYQSGHWPIDLARPVDMGDPRLKIQGISTSSRGPLVVVNDTTIASGDTVVVHPPKGASQAGGSKLTITCQETGADYVLVAIAGESNLKLLSTERISRR